MSVVLALQAVPQRSYSKLSSPGIGITPTLSLMLSYAGKKRINIIWMCRDPGLVEYFLHKVDITAVTKNSFALIFYTGKQNDSQHGCRVTVCVHFDITLA